MYENNLQDYKFKYLDACKPQNYDSYVKLKDSLYYGILI